MVRCLLERKVSPAREITGALRTGRERKTRAPAAAVLDPACASPAQMASCATITSSRFCAPITCA